MFEQSEWRSLDLQILSRHTVARAVYVASAFLRHRAQPHAALDRLITCCTSSLDKIDTPLAIPSRST